MNKEIKKEWLEALRSGEYKQGTDQLSNDDGTFCCLGVLCELAVKYGIVEKDDGAYQNPFDHYDRQFFALPICVRDWAELGETNPQVQTHIDDPSLAALNDSGSSFAEIAAIIEEQL